MPRDASRPRGSAWPAIPLRQRLRRRVARARWPEYRSLLEAALAHGYDVEPLDRWIGAGAAAVADRPVLVLRHDVDQQPAAVEPMAAIEEELGLRSTWYFRWRTAEPRVIHRLQRRSHSVGLHYETLTRTARELGLGPGDEGEELMAHCRDALRAEIAAWARRYGKPRSICPHGDTGVPWLANAALLRGRRPAEFGVEFDSNEAMRGRELGHWLTDRSVAEGLWADGVDPLRLLERGATPILSVTHPNNWSSGLSLTADRVLGRALPRAVERSGRHAWPLRTGPDTPPAA